LAERENNPSTRNKKPPPFFCLQNATIGLNGAQSPRLRKPPVWALKLPNKKSPRSRAQANKFVFLAERNSAKNAEISPLLARFATWFAAPMACCASAASSRAPRPPRRPEDREQRARFGLL
jgi:hypothetical protein